MRKENSFLRGTVVIIGTHIKQLNFSLNKAKKTHLIYAGKKRETTSVDEMTLLNTALLKDYDDKEAGRKY